MAIRVIASANAAINASRSPSVNFGGGYAPVQGDVVVMFPSSTTTAAITIPSGWVNAVGGTTDFESDVHQLCAVYHIVTAGEETGGTTTYTATNLYNATETGNVVACALRGVNLSSVIDDWEYEYSTANSTPHVLAGLTTGNLLSDGSVVISAVAKHGTGAYATAPAGWSFLTNTNTNQGKALLVRNTSTRAGVAFGTTNITPSAGDEYVSITLGFTVASWDRTHNFHDSFNNGIDTNRWSDAYSNNPSNVTSVSGGVQLAYGTGPEYSEIRSNDRFDLTGSSVFVQVADFGNLSNESQEVYLDLIADDNNSLQIIVAASGDNIAGGYEVAGSWTAISWISLNQTSHRWWRIREVGGTIYYDTAPDGVTWTNRWSVAVPINITALQMRLVAGIYSTESSGASARFDNFNSYGLPKAHTMRDNFEAGINGSVWVEAPDPADIYPSSGSIRIDHGIGPEYNFLQTTNHYDLTESSCFVELVDAGNQTFANHETSMIISFGDSNQFNFYVVNGNLGIFLNDNGTPVGIGAIPYNSTNHRWLRVREARGRLYFDTSPNGLNWTNQLAVTTFFNMSAVKLTLLAGAGAADASGSYGIFDNFNTQDLPKAETLTDDFTGDTLDSGKWTTDAASGGDISVVDDRLRLETEGSAYSWANITSVDHFDLTDSAVYVQIPDPGNRPTGWAARLYVLPSASSTDWARLYVSDQYSVVAQVSNNDELVYNEGTWDYDPAVHRWIRIRESGSELYFAYSADGFDWVEPLSTTVANWSMTALQVSLDIQADTASSGQISYFDHLNTPWNGPVYRSSAELALASGTSVNLPVPAGVEAGDVLLAFVFLKNNGGAGAPMQTMSGVPSGFSQINLPYDYTGQRDVRVFTYWKRAIGADVGTYGFTLNSSHPEFSGFTLRYSGCAVSGNPVEAWTGAGNDTVDTTPDVGIASNGASRLIVHANVSNAGYRIVAPAAGYALDASGPNDNSSHGWGFLSREQEVAGSTGAVSASWHSSHTGMTISGLYALRGAAISAGKNTEFFFLYDS